MSPEFYAYRTFLSIRNHFRREDYDFFFYHGKTKGSPEAFKANKNYHQFQTLSRKVPHEEMVSFIASNFGHCKRETVWITDLLTPDAMDVHRATQTYIESATYRFEEDLKKVWPLGTAMAFRTDSYPSIVSAAMSGKIAIETLCLLDKLNEGNILRHLDSGINEKYLWPQFYLRCRKYTPFLNCENEKLRMVIDKMIETK